MPDKPKIAMYWAASCGGCEISLLNINEKLIDLEANFELVFCPCIMDTKKKSVEKMKDGEIDITFFNGAVRTDENEEMAHLMRQKSKLLVAFGSCSHEGCIPALSNLYSKEDHFRTIYLDNPSTENPEATVPLEQSSLDGRVMRLPAFHQRVKTLGQVSEVDYAVPGCPPEPHQIWNIIETLIQGKPLPAKGAVIGAGLKAVCDECPRERQDKRIEKLYRTYEIVPDEKLCLLDQGILCMGIATRDGCGAPCPQANQPCTGCYGPPEGILDQGAKMISALGASLDIGDKTGISQAELMRRVDEILDAVPDYAGTVYKYSLAGSILRGRQHEKDNG
jgi:F420-non-reducing hydrogenase small subunit